MPDPIDRLTLERDRLQDDCAVAVALAEALIAENVSLRAERDRLRDAIQDQGFQVLDGPEGSQLRPL